MILLISSRSVVVIHSLFLIYYLFLVFPFILSHVHDLLYFPFQRTTSLLMLFSCFLVNKFQTLLGSVFFLQDFIFFLKAIFKATFLTQTLDGFPYKLLGLIVSFFWGIALAISFMFWRSLSISSKILHIGVCFFLLPSYYMKGILTDYFYFHHMAKLNIFWY